MLTFINSLKSSTEDFVNRFKQFRRRFMAPKMTRSNMIQTDGAVRPRIRIALLDTGICKEKTLLSSYITEVKDYRKSRGFTEAEDRDPMKADNQKCFVRGERSVLDESSCGHGTQLACLLLKFAPDADLYIAKVSRDMDFPVTEGVVEVSTHVYP
jgi:hypothetical protein